MYNTIILAGNLTRDIEIKYMQNGSAIGSTAIATSRKFKAQDGTQKEEVMFIDITFFGRTAEIANQYLRKGSKVLVDGRLKLDQWTAQDGSKRSKHSVIVEELKMLGSKEDAAPTGGNEPVYETSYEEHQTPVTQTAPTRPAQQRAAAPASEYPEIDINEDEIPF